MSTTYLAMAPAQSPAGGRGPRPGPSVRGVSPGSGLLSTGTPRHERHPTPALRHPAAPQLRSDCRVERYPALPGKILHRDDDLRMERDAVLPTIHFRRLLVIARDVDLVVPLGRRGGAQCRQIAIDVGLEFVHRAE